MSPCQKKISCHPLIDFFQRRQSARLLERTSVFEATTDLIVLSQHFRQPAEQRSRLILSLPSQKDKTAGSKRQQKLDFTHNIIELWTFFLSLCERYQIVSSEQGAEKTAFFICAQVSL